MDLCRFWVKVAFWDNERTNGKSLSIKIIGHPKPKSRNCQLVVNGVVAIGWMERIIKL